MLVRTFTGEAPGTPRPRGVIDTQTHMYLPGFPSAPGAISLPLQAPGPVEYRQVMGWLGIDRVVVTQGNAHGHDNSNLVACLEVMGDDARGVGVITGATTDAEMKRLADAGVVGARIMDLPGGAVGLAGLPAVDRRAADFDWCVAVQFDGSNILSHEPLLAGVRSRWILDHHGKFFAGISPDGPELDAVKRLIDRGNCWFKFAACYESSRSGGPDYEDIGAVARVVAAYAPERIIWGTNWPHNGASRTEDYPNDGALFDLAMSWLPDAPARELCLSTNPAQLFFQAR